MPSLKELQNKLRPQIDRATKGQIKKIEERYKKEREKEVTGKKKDDDDAPKRRYIATDLDEIVALKKKKAVSNELDEFLYEQEERKKTRTKPLSAKKEEKDTNPVADLLMANPEKLENVSEDSIMKLAMLMGGNKGGGMNPLLMMMLMGQNQSQPNSIVELVTALKTMKEMSDEDKPKGNGNNDMQMMLMMLMMQQQNQRNQPKQDTGINEKDKLTAQLFQLISQQNVTERQLVMDKLKEIEYRAANVDPMNEAKRMIDYMGTFKTLFGGEQTPAAMSHDLELQKLKFEQQKDMRKSVEQESRMSQVGDLISKSIGTFADVLAKPMADGLKNRIENPRHPKQPDYGQVPMSMDDLDLDIDKIPPDYYNPETQPPQTKGGRFQVRSSDSEDEDY